MVTLTADVPQEAAFATGAGSTSSVAWSYLVDDAAAAGAVLATSPTYASRPGCQPTVTLTGRVPVGMAGLAVTVRYAYLDAALAELGAGTVDTFAATTATAARTITLPTAPAGTRYWRLELQLNEGVSLVPYRTNLFPTPRPDIARFPVGARTWGISAATGVAGIGVADLASVYSSYKGFADTGTYRGFDVGPAIDGATPTGATGVAVTAGDTLTFSAYVLSTKAVTLVPSVRFYAGSAWSAAAVAGAGVALTAGVWTRVSVTATVPAGATGMAGALWVPASVAYLASDMFKATGFLLEKSAAVGAWFAGDYTPDGHSARWLGVAGNSQSQLYTPGQPQGRTLVLSGVTAQVSAVADEILTAGLKRPLRRSVYDALNTAAPQIAVGTPGLLSGALVYLCADLADALAVDSVYQYAGTVTLTTGDTLDGFAHMAVETLDLDAERPVPGRPARWLVRAQVREVR